MAAAAQVARALAVLAVLAARLAHERADHLLTRLLRPAVVVAVRVAVVVAQAVVRRQPAAPAEPRVLQRRQRPAVVAVDAALPARARRARV